MTHAAAHSFTFTFCWTRFSGFGYFGVEKSAACE